MALPVADALAIRNNLLTIRDDDEEDPTFTDSDADAVDTSKACDYTRTFDSLDAVRDFVYPEVKAELASVMSAVAQPTGAFDPVGQMATILPQLTPKEAVDQPCRSYYTLTTLITMLDKAYDDYQKTNAGYDELFDFYKNYMRDSVPDLLLYKIMYTMQKDNAGNTIACKGPGQTYFDCTINDRTSACRNRTMAINELGDPITYKLRDADGFRQELTDEGLSLDWVTYGDSTIQSSIHGCSESEDIVTSALDHLPQLRSDMQATALEMASGQWSAASMADPAQVYSVPVFLMLQGVDSMQQAKDAAQKMKDEQAKEDAERMKNIILLVISMVLFSVPVLGPELATAAGLGSLARSIAILGELGNGAMAIYDTVNDPKSAPVNVIGAVLGLGGLTKALRTEKGLGDVAVIRAGMKPETIAGFGKVFKESDSKMQGLIALCHK